MRTQALVVGFYALDALLMGGYVALGVLPAQAPWLFGLAGIGLTALFATAVRLGLHRRIGGARLTVLQLLSACGLMLATAAALPQIGVLLLLTLVVAVATAAVQLERRHVLGITWLVATGSMLLLLVRGELFGLPLADRFERLLSGLWFLIVLTKIAVIHLIGDSLRRALQNANAQLNEALARVQALSERDELTGLPNRRSAMLQLEQARRAADGGPGFAVALIDIDHFKRVNDSWGHAVGDAVLRRFAQVATGSLRQGDHVARWGGEEFLLVLAAGAAAEQAADRVRRAVLEHPWGELAPGLALSCSVGVASWRGGEGLEALLQRADTALYRAKAGGRNATCAG